MEWINRYKHNVIIDYEIGFSSQHNFHQVIYTKMVMSFNHNWIVKYDCKTWKIHFGTFKTRKWIHLKNSMLQETDLHHHHHHSCIYQLTDRLDEWNTQKLNILPRNKKPTSECILWKKLSQLSYTFCILFIK